MFENSFGNQSIYDLSNVEPFADSPLKGKSILYLGSSITLGYGSQNVSFADYIAKRNGNTFVKEAVSGTTLTDDSPDSYVSRLHKVDTAQHFDLFVCQLSTNDFSKFKPIGEVSDTEPSTVCGAINYIVTYVREKWNCPIVFYTSPYFEAKAYRQMVDDLLQIAAQRSFEVIDMYDNAKFNDIPDEQRALYMVDAMHPTKAGYLLWWTPEFEPYLYAAIQRM